MKYKTDFVKYKIVSRETKEQSACRHLSWKIFVYIHMNKKLKTTNPTKAIYKNLYCYFVCHFSRHDNDYDLGEFLLNMFANGEYDNANIVSDTELKEYISKFIEIKNNLVIVKDI